MHRSRSNNSFRGPPRRDFDGRARSPQRRFGFDDNGPGPRRFDSFRNRSPPRGRPMNYHARGGPGGGFRDERPMGAPFSQARPFGSNRPMFQLRVENLCGDIRDQDMKQDLLHIFRRHGNCSVYVVDIGRGMTKEAYVTFWSLDESRNARRSENEQRLYNIPMLIHVQREPRVFGMTRPVGHAEMRREIRDPNFRPDHRSDSGPRSRSEGRSSMSDDSIPTRTLFVGNLDSSTRNQKLHEVFGKFGAVEDVDIKAPRNGASGTFAFVRFAEIASAKEAKLELQQSLIGASRIRLGYGRGTPSARIHISGLGSWCSLDWLEREFDRFGTIHHIEYSSGDPMALVSFDSVDAASAAAREMNRADGKDLEHSIVVSFAESRTGGPVQDFDDSVDRESNAGRTAPSEDKESHRRKRHSSVSSESAPASETTVCEQVAEDSSEQPASSSHQKRRRRRTSSSDEDSQAKRVATAAAVPSVSHSLLEVASGLQLLWTGALALRKMSFAMKMFVVSGDPSLASNFLTSDVELVSITQRLRLDAEKLDEVRRRMTSSGPKGYCVLLAVSADSDESTVANSERTSQGKEEKNGDLQVKPLRNLVLFLKQKQAAGVAQLSPAAKDSAESTTERAETDMQDQSTGNSSSSTETGCGVLHAFPPSEFSQEQLASVTTAPELSDTTQDEEHLVIVIVGK
ncbi:RNA-binding protein 15-like [Sycon ciliatum]|uniref:RNA-binding protein 15-like n=1 Tax=Sycon ciliatum TaxID=27933 RepID=UPI0020ABCF88|eukprot:scpid43754/ scgid14885/ Putative RNA-binding protein 15; One-twenty two protein 1; RNA-binding motif protein 15